MIHSIQAVKTQPAMTSSRAWLILFFLTPRTVTTMAHGDGGGALEGKAAEQSKLLEWDEPNRDSGGSEVPDRSVWDEPSSVNAAAVVLRLRRESALLAAPFSFVFLCCICELSIGTWLPAYATLKGLADPTEAAVLGSFYWGCFTAGRISGRATLPHCQLFCRGAVGDRCGRPILI